MKLNSHDKLVLAVCFVLSAATTICITDSPHRVNLNHKRHKILSAKSTIAKIAEPPQPKEITTPSPPPTLPPKPLEPELKRWQGEVQPVAIAPASIPVINKIPTTEPVVFLTIDDGWIKPPDAHDWMVEHKLPFTLFLTDNGIKNDYGYFKDLQKAGMVVENHTISHINLESLILPQQQAEICTAADQYKTVFGQRPTLLRPPYGAYNELTRQAAVACGMKAIVLWRAVIEHGIMQFQYPETHLTPGDIVLMHFSPDMMADLQAFINQAESDHLKVARLEDWLR